MYIKTGILIIEKQQCLSSWYTLDTENTAVNSADVGSALTEVTAEGACG